MQGNYTSGLPPKTRKNRENHHDSFTRLYNIWNSMRHRCRYKSSTSYKYYGARGITVCNEWDQSYMAFKKWSLDNGYTDDLSIDRIDNSKGYSPENCRWISGKEQRRNRPGFVRLMTYKGKTQCIAAWIEEYGISRSTIWKKRKKGYTDSEIIEYCISLKETKEG